jgi:hypothetical protein
LWISYRRFAQNGSLRFLATDREQEATRQTPNDPQDGRLRNHGTGPMPGAAGGAHCS